MNQKLWIVLLVLAVSVISFGRSFLGFVGVIPWNYGYSDIFNEDRINPELGNKIPYLKTPVEYPLITGFFVYAMWHFGKNILGYSLLTGIFLSLCSVITAIALYGLCDIFEIRKQKTYLFFIFAPSLMLFSIYNWDIIAVMFTVLALYSFSKSQFLLSGVFLSLGFNAKLFPVILLPLMMLKTDFKNSVKMAAMFLIVSLALNGYFIVNSFEVWKATYTFHAAREPNMDSTWALTHLGVDIVNILSAALFLLAYLILAFNHKKYDLVTISFMSILLFLVFNKVFSPQFILWLLPFFVLSQAISKKEFYLLEFLNIAVFFSTAYWLLASRLDGILLISQISVVLRSLILAYLVFVLFKSKDCSPSGQKI